MNIREYISSHSELSEASIHDPGDESLSSGQKALAQITHVIAEHADRLDGAQLEGLVAALSAYRDDVQHQESAAWAILNSGQWNDLQTNAAREE